mmetsp:Transcript_16036/g.30516  ORF Transcript_16036/g.30516 Transcript_16036/m.30516 type:complete len:183 (-) Transcript_16036:72-620(-)|eukprot:scaffold10723_cov164-Amphora_coffeaeformis.AAC.11
MTRIAHLPRTITATWKRARSQRGGDFVLTLHRATKTYMGFRAWPVTCRGEYVGALENGGEIVVRGRVGDRVEVAQTDSCKSRDNTYEMVIRQPGDLTLKLEQVGDVTFYVLLVAVFAFVFLTVSGLFFVGLIPFALGLLLSISSFYQYCQARGREIAPHRQAKNPDLESGAIVHETSRGCCG